MKIYKRITKGLIAVAMGCILSTLGLQASLYGASSDNRKARMSREAESRRKKARHYFLAASIAEAEGRQPEAYELYKKALQSDPEFKEASYHFGVARLHNNLDTLRSDHEMQRSINMIRKFVDASPDDFQENLYYAYITGFTDPEEASRVYQRIADKNPERTAILLQLAETQIRSRKIKEAIGTLERYEQIEGATPEVSMRKIGLIFHQADTVGAMSEANRLAELYPSDIRFRMLRSSLAGAIGDTLLMEQDLLESNHIEPDNASVKLALADLAHNRGDSVTYDKYVYEALISPGLELEDKRDLLGQYLQQLLNDKGDTSRGNHLFEAMGKLYPHQPELLDLEARYRMAIGEKSQGIELIEYATALAPENETYRRQLMSYAISAKKYDIARKAYQDALQVMNPDTDTILLYALACSLDKNADAALEAYGKVIEPIIGTTDLMAPIEEMTPLPKIDMYQSDILKGVYASASDVLWKNKRIEDTFAVCRNAYFLSPDDPFVLNNYAYFLAEADRDLPMAREMAEKAIAAEPENPTYLDTYAWVLFKAGDYADALKYQRQAMEIATHSKEHVNPGEGEEEEEESRQPDVNSEFYDHLAQILKANGEYKEAKEAAAKAKELKEKDD